MNMIENDSKYIHVSMTEEQNSSIIYILYYNRLLGITFAISEADDFLSFTQSDLRYIYKYSRGVCLRCYKGRMLASSNYNNNENLMSRHTKRHFVHP